MALSAPTQTITRGVLTLMGSEAVVNPAPTNTSVFDARAMEQTTFVVNNATSGSIAYTVEASWDPAGIFVGVESGNLLAGESDQVVAPTYCAYLRVRLQFTTAGTGTVNIYVSGRGRLAADVADPIPVSVIVPAFTYQRLIGTGAAQQIKSGTGVLHAVITDAGVTVAAYDATSGLTGQILGVVSGALLPSPIDLTFTIGLRMVVQSTKPYTVVYQ